MIARGVRQFGRPHGVPGRLAGWVMAHRSSNRQRSFWVGSLLDVQPTDRVLEAGFAGAPGDPTAGAGRELHDLLPGAGFVAAGMETLPLPPPVACVLATKPADG